MKKIFFKTFLPLVAVILVGVAVISCEKEKGSATVYVSDITYTHCKGNAEKTLDNDSVVVGYSNGVVSIAHYNLDVPCDFTHVSVMKLINGDTIRISEASDGGYVDCVCHIDNFFRINNVKGIKTLVIENCYPPYCQTFNF